MHKELFVNTDLYVRNKVIFTLNCAVQLVFKSSRSFQHGPETKVVSEITVFFQRITTFSISVFTVYSLDFFIREQTDSLQLLKRWYSVLYSLLYYISHF